MKIGLFEIKKSLFFQNSQVLFCLTFKLKTLNKTIAKIRFFLIKFHQFPDI